MIHTNIIAKVERFSGGTADLEPLFLDDNNQPYEKIINARVLSQRFSVDGGANKLYKPHFSKGDIVAVAIFERDLSDAIGGKRGNGGNFMKHELSSAVILGLIE